ncbi:MAG TPA: EcsC family protein [bacterium]|nr:EcsC family protein [bacterium]
MKFSQTDLADLRTAKKILENPGIAAKLTDLLATPIERGFEMLPPKWSALVNLASQKSLQKALDFSILTLDEKTKDVARNRWHKIAVATVGAAGGAFGLSAVPIELPASTMIILRSIADIARIQGEDLRDPEARLNCLQVFALGGRSTADDAAETGYYAIRLSLSKLISDAASFIAERGLSKKSAPVLVKLISIIASRFSAAVSQKVAAMAIPVLGAVGGAAINTVFIDHFQKMALGHFIVRRLERKYGIRRIREQYDRIQLQNSA